MSPAGPVLQPDGRARRTHLYLLYRAAERLGWNVVERFPHLTVERQREVLAYESLRSMEEQEQHERAKMPQAPRHR